MTYDEDRPESRSGSKASRASGRELRRSAIQRGDILQPPRRPNATPPTISDRATTKAGTNPILLGRDAPQPRHRRPGEPNSTIVSDREAPERPRPSPAGNSCNVAFTSTGPPSTRGRQQQEHAIATKTFGTEDQERHRGAYARLDEANQDVVGPSSRIRPSSADADDCSDAERTEQHAVAGGIHVQQVGRDEGQQRPDGHGWQQEQAWRGQHGPHDQGDQRTKACRPEGRKKRSRRMAVRVPGIRTRENRAKIRPVSALKPNTGPRPTATITSGRSPARPLGPRSRSPRRAQPRIGAGHAPPHPG